MRRALRHSILFNNGKFDTTFLMMSIWESKGEKFDQPEQIIEKLAKLIRNCDERVFTVRKIASLLSISANKVSRLTSKSKSSRRQDTTKVG